MRYLLNGWALGAFFALMFCAMVGNAAHNSYLEETRCTANGGHPYPGNGWFNYSACIYGKDVKWDR